MRWPQHPGSWQGRMESMSSNPRNVPSVRLEILECWAFMFIKHLIKTQNHIESYEFLLRITGHINHEWFSKNTHYGKKGWDDNMVRCCRCDKEHGWDINSVQMMFHPTPSLSCLIVFLWVNCLTPFCTINLDKQRRKTRARTHTHTHNVLSSKSFSHFIKPQHEQARLPDPDWSEIQTN